MTRDELEPGMLLKTIALFSGFSGFDICYIDPVDPYYGRVYSQTMREEFHEEFPRGSEQYIKIVKAMIKERKEAIAHATEDVAWMEQFI